MFSQRRRRLLEQESPVVGSVRFDADPRRHPHDDGGDGHQQQDPRRRGNNNEDDEDNSSRGGSSKSSARSLNLLDSSDGDDNDSDDATRSPSSPPYHHQYGNHGWDNNQYSPSTQTINNLSQESAATDLRYDMSQLDDDVAEAEAAKNANANAKAEAKEAEDKMELEEHKKSNDGESSYSGSGADTASAGGGGGCSTNSGAISSANATTTKRPPPPRENYANNANANDDPQRPRQRRRPSFTPAADGRIAATETSPPSPQQQQPPAGADDAGSSPDPSIICGAAATSSNDGKLPQDDSGGVRMSSSSSATFRVDLSNYSVLGFAITDKGPTGVRIARLTAPPANLLLPSSPSAQHQQQQKTCRLHGFNEENCSAERAGLEVGDVFLSLELGVPGSDADECAFAADAEAALIRERGIILDSKNNNKKLLPTYEDVHGILKGGKRPLVMVVAREKKEKKKDQPTATSSTAATSTTATATTTGDRQLTPPPQAASTAAAVTVTAQRDKESHHRNNNNNRPSSNNNENEDDEQEITTSITPLLAASLSQQSSSKRVTFTLPSSATVAGADGGGESHDEDDEDGGNTHSSCNENKLTSNEEEEEEEEEGAVTTGSNRCAQQQSILGRSSSASTATTKSSFTNNAAPVLLTTTRAGLRGRVSSSSTALTATATATAVAASSSQKSSARTPPTATTTSSIVPFCALCNGRYNNNNKRRQQVHHTWCPKQQHFERSGAKDVLERLRLGVTRHNCQLCKEAYQRGRWPSNGSSSTATMKHSAACQRAHQQREAEKKRLAAAAVAARATASKRKRNDEAAPLFSSSSSSSDSSDDDDGNYTQRCRQSSQQQATAARSRRRRERSRRAPTSSAAATATKNRSRNARSNNAVINNGSCSSSDEDGDEDERVRRRRGGGGRNNKAAAVGKTNGRKRSRTMNPTNDKASSRTAALGRNAKQTGNKKTKKKGRSITPNNSGGGGDDSDGREDESHQRRRKWNDDDDDDFDPFGNDTDVSDLEVAEVEWVPVQHDPWGPRGYQEDDVILFTATNTRGGGGGRAPSAQQQLRHHSQYETLLPSPRFVLNPFESYKQYCKTHTTPEEGFHVIELNRDPFATLPWGFSYERHEFGGACLVKNVEPMSPAATAVFLAEDSAARGLRVNDMIIAVGGKRVGGMTVNGFDIELEISGPALCLIVSRCKFASQVERRIQQAERTYLNAIDQAMNDERRLGWVDISVSHHPSSSSSRATMPTSTIRTAVTATSSSAAGLISNHNELQTATMNANDSSNNNHLLGQHGGAHDGIDSSIALLASAAMMTQPDNAAAAAAAAEPTSSMDVDDGNEENEETTPASPPAEFTAMEQHQQEGYSHNDDKSSQENDDDEVDPGTNPGWFDDEQRSCTEQPNSSSLSVSFNSSYHLHNTSTNEGTAEQAPFVMMENGVGLEFELEEEVDDDVVDNGHHDDDDDDDYSGEGNARMGCVCGAIHGIEIPVFWAQCECCQSWYNVSSDCIGLTVDEVANAPSWRCWGCPSDDEGSSLSQGDGGLDRDDAVDPVSNSCGGAQFPLSSPEAIHLDDQQIPEDGGSVHTEEVPFVQNGSETTAPMEGEHPTAHLNSGSWSTDEQDRYLDAIAIHGRNWQLVSEAVRTRSLTQVKKHAYDTKTAPPSAPPSAAAAARGRRRRTPKEDGRATEDGCVRPKNPPEQRADGTYARPHGRAPTGFKWDEKGGVYAPIKTRGGITKEKPSKSEDNPPTQHQRSRSAPSLRSRKHGSSSPEEKAGEATHDDISQPKVFADGSMVFIQEHGWAKVNNEAGYATILKSYEDDEDGLVYDVKYVVGRHTVKGVEAEFVGPSDI